MVEIENTCCYFQLPLLRCNEGAFKSRDPSPILQAASCKLHGTEDVVTRERKTATAPGSELDARLVSQLE